MHAMGLHNIFGHERQKNLLRVEVETHIVDGSSARAHTDLGRMLGNGEIRDINRIDATDTNKRKYSLRI